MPSQTTVSAQWQPQMATGWQQLQQSMMVQYGQGGNVSSNASFAYMATQQQQQQQRTGSTFTQAQHAFISNTSQPSSSLASTGMAQQQSPLQLWNPSFLPASSTSPVQAAPSALALVHQQALGAAAMRQAATHTPTQGVQLIQQQPSSLPQHGNTLDGDSAHQPQPQPDIQQAGNAHPQPFHTSNVDLHVIEPTVHQEQQHQVPPQEEQAEQQAPRPPGTDESLPTHSERQSDAEAGVSRDGSRDRQRGRGRRSRSHSRSRSPRRRRYSRERQGHSRERSSREASGGPGRETGAARTGTAGRQREEQQPKDLDSPPSADHSRQRTRDHQPLRLQNSNSSRQERSSDNGRSDRDDRPASEPRSDRPHEEADVRRDTFKIDRRPRNRDEDVDADKARSGAHDPNPDDGPEQRQQDDSFDEEGAHAHAQGMGGRQRQSRDGMGGDGAEQARQDRLRSSGGVSNISNRRDRPSSTVFVRGVPPECEEADLMHLLAGFPNMTSLRVVRDRTNPMARGIGFVDFASVDDARLLMEDARRHVLEFEGQRLTFEYTQNALGAIGNSAAPGPSLGAGSGSGPGSGPPLDWVCGRCNAVNFARRLECYQCSSIRPRDPLRVTVDSEGPSLVLKVSGLEPHVSEEVVYSMVAPHAEARDVRFVRDKFTGAPRGFAFVEFNTVMDAGRVLDALQNRVPACQSTPLRMCYGRDKQAERTAAGPPPRPAPASSLAADALGAAQSMQQYSSWEPKAFDWEPKAFGAAAEDTDAAATLSAAAATVTQAAAVGNGSSSAAQGAPAAAAEAVASSSAPGGFAFDAASGYWYDAASGLHYDANTGLYYQSASQQWYSYDHATAKYTAVGAGDSTAVASGPAAASSGTPTAAAAAVTAVASSSVGRKHEVKRQAVSSAAAATAAVAVAAPAEVGMWANRSSVAVAAATAKVSAPERRRASAVMGSAPKLNSQGLLVAAQQALPTAARVLQEREQAQRAAAVAEEREKARKDLAAAKLATQAVAAAARALVFGAGAHPGQAQQRSAAAPPAAQVMPSGPVQGVVHKSKWAQRAAQQQGQ
ncbi:MAG: hypothetical protein WDW36_004780 [Sanguina aurantia]